MKVHKLDKPINSRAITPSPLLRTQFILNNRSTKKIAQFMRQLFSSPVFSKKIIFDKLTGEKLERETDPEMDLEKFISLLGDKKSLSKKIVLQVGNPHESHIVFAARVQDASKITRFAWFECLYNGRNLEIINKIFKDVFGKEMFK